VPEAPPHRFLAGRTRGCARLEESAKTHQILIVLFQQDRGQPLMGNQSPKPALLVNEL
jgi:hypothetical protein